MSTTATTHTTARRAPAAPRLGGGRRSATTAAGRPLSNNQKAVISQTARQAFDLQDRIGYVQTTGSDSKRFETWRREQQGQAVGISSLRECGNNHYRPLMAHFLTLAGKDASAFRLLVKTGPTTGHGPAEDTHEARESLRQLILQELLAHGHRCDPAHPDHSPATAATVTEKGGLITAGYVFAIARQKCRGRGLDSLTADQLHQLLSTTRNRIAAREGRGAAATRNTKQRKTPTP